MRPSYDMNNYLVSKAKARIVEHTPLQTAARCTHARGLPFRNTEGSDAKLVNKKKTSVK